MQRYDAVINNHYAKRHKGQHIDVYALRIHQYHLFIHRTHLQFLRAGGVYYVRIFLPSATQGVGKLRDCDFIMFLMC